MKTDYMNPRYIVKEGHTLGIRINKDTMEVLHGSVILGGHNWMNGPVMYSEDHIRQATAEDFVKFRVMLPPDFYVEPELTNQMVYDTL